MNAVRSYRDVAKALGLDVPTVQAIEYRAMKKCRVALLRECPDGFEDMREIFQTSQLPTKRADTGSGGSKAVARRVEGVFNPVVPAARASNNKPESRIAKKRC